MWYDEYAVGCMEAYEKGGGCCDNMYSQHLRHQRYRRRADGLYRVCQSRTDNSLYSRTNQTDRSATVRHTIHSRIGPIRLAGMLVYSSTIVSQTAASTVQATHSKVKKPKMTIKTYSPYRHNISGSVRPLTYFHLSFCSRATGDYHSDKQPHDTREVVTLRPHRSPSPCRMLHARRIDPSYALVIFTCTESHDMTLRLC